MNGTMRQMTWDELLAEMLRQQARANVATDRADAAENAVKALRVQLEHESSLLEAPFRARAEAAELRAEELEAALRDIEQWTQVAFYPGPNENPHFQAGFQEAVGVAAGIVARLLAALAPQAGETPPGAQGREGVGRADR